MLLAPGLTNRKGQHTELDIAIHGKQDIVGLYVSMNDTFGVQVL